MEVLWDFVSPFIVFFLGLCLTSVYAKKVQLSFSRAAALYLSHTIWCLVYVWYTLNNVADSLLFYEVAENNVAFSLGTKVPIKITYILRQFELSYISVSLVFNIIGSLGLLFFDASLKRVARTSGAQLLALMVVLSPSISFWTAGIGKDSIAFLGVCLCLWSATSFQKHYVALFIGLLLMFLVRPHIGIIMLMALCVAMLMSKNISLAFRLSIGGIVIASTILLVSFVMQYVGLATLDVDAIRNYILIRQGGNMHGGGGVDIASMSFPMQITTYILRPFPFEANNIPAFAASIDNMVLLMVLVAGGFQLKPINFRSNVFLWAYFIIGVSILAMTTANLGISLRQKWMVMPVLIYLMLDRMGKKT